MKVLQEKLDYLLDKYSVSEKAVLKDKSTVVAFGKEIPLLSHRYERRFTELKNIATGGTLQNISVMRVARIIQKGEDIYNALARELDLCEYILDDKLSGITAMQNDNTLNIIASTEKGIVCTLEISATLSPGTTPIDKHEIISERGIACDVVVDAQIKQDSVYVYGASESKYTDVDFELYGLGIEDIAIVRAAFSVARADCAEDNIKRLDTLNKYTEAARKSAECCERVVL